MLRVGDLVEIVGYEWNKDLEEPVKVIAEYPEYYDVLIKFNNGEEKIQAIPKDTLLFDDTYDVEILKSTIDCIKMIDTEGGRTFKILPCDSDQWEIYQRYNTTDDYNRAIKDVKKIMLKGGRKLREKRYQQRGRPMMTYDQARDIIDFVLMHKREFEIYGADAIELGVRRFPHGGFEFYINNLKELEQ